MFICKFTDLRFLARVVYARTLTKTVSSDFKVHASKCCRFRKKNVLCTGTKVARVSLFSATKNKELVAFTGVESLVLADVVALLAHSVARHEQLSNVQACATFTSCF